MNLRKFIEGITILRPYFDDQDGYHIGAEHDQFYVYKTDRPLSADDAKKMLALGWTQELDYSADDAPDSGERTSYLLGVQQRDLRRIQFLPVLWPQIRDRTP